MNQQTKSVHQLEDETKLIKQTAVSSLFKEIKNAQAHFHPVGAPDEDAIFSSRMAGSLQMYLLKDGQTVELRRLREVAEKVREELDNIGGEAREDRSDMTPTRMEFIDYRKAYIRIEKVKKVKEEAKTFKFRDTVVQGLNAKVSETNEKEGPTSKIDKMDYSKVSLDTIAKLPNRLPTAKYNPPVFSDQNLKMSEAD